MLAVHPLTRRFGQRSDPGMAMHLGRLPERALIVLKTGADGLVDLIALQRSSPYGTPSIPTLYPMGEAATLGDALVLWGAPDSITGDPSLQGWWDLDHDDNCTMVHCPPKGGDR